MQETSSSARLPVAVARPVVAHPAAAVVGTAVATRTVEKQGGGAEDGRLEYDGGVLSVIIRPLPSTAPASLDSDSSRGEGWLLGCLVA